MKRQNEKNYYEILGVPKNASQDDIKDSYKKLMLKHHPDKGGNEEMAKSINEAYDVLGNVDKRKQHDNPQPQFQGFNPFNHFGSSFDNINFDDILMNHFANKNGFSSFTNVVSSQINIPLIKAIVGGEVEVNTLIGKIKFNIPASTQPNTTFKIRVQNKNNKNHQTILQLTVFVEIPINLSDEQKEKLKEILK